MDEFGLITVTAARAQVVRDFTTSELFDRTFQEGMELVEETAAYLDGPGRQESKLLSRGAALAYASTSMRLTTKLMQVASWLLVQRAVREGDMSPQEACQGRYRLGGDRGPAPADPEAEHLPPGLLTLSERAERLYERVAHLDRRMYMESADGEVENPVLHQFARLENAFGGLRR
jgi:regulator of CtrA degradation